MEVLSQDHSRVGERGVTLIETLVAVLILSFVAVSTLAMFSQGMRLNAAGADYTAITNAAKDKAEELLALDYHHADLTIDVDFEETRANPPVTVRWRVAQHMINEDNIDPATVLAGNPMVSTAPGTTGNVKILRVTAVSEGVFAAGRRDVTIVAIKVDHNFQPSP